MSRKDAILSLRAILIKKRDALRLALTGDLSLLHELRTQDTGDSADGAMGTANDEISSQLAEVETRELTLVENALDRMLAGNFGKCEGCGADILMARLNALPNATHCIKCQRECEGDTSVELPDLSRMADSSDNYADPEGVSVMSPFAK